MVYELDLVGKFKIRYWNQKICDAKINDLIGYFKSINETAEQIEKESIAEKTPEWLTLIINDEYRICFQLEENKSLYSVELVTSVFRSNCGETNNPYDYYIGVKILMDENWADYCSQIEKKKVELKNRKTGIQKSKKLKEIENSAMYAFLKKEFEGSEYEWEYYPKSSTFEIHEGRNNFISIKFETLNDPKRNISRIKEIIDDRARYEKENRLQISSLYIKLEAEESNS